MLGGVVRFQVPELRYDARQAAVAGAGPAATAVLLALGGCAQLLLSEPGAALGVALAANLKVGLGTLFINLLPWRLPGGFESDGQMLLRYWQSR